MTLDELLDHLRRDLLHDRSDQIEGDSDRLWSDTTLIRYINEAQRRFARRSLCIRDGGSLVTRFRTVAYQEVYSLDPSILAVTSARSFGNGTWVNGTYVAGYYEGEPVVGTTPVLVPLVPGTELVHPDEADLGRTGHALLQTRPQIDNSFFDVNRLSRLGPGKPLAFATDEYDVSDDGPSGAIALRLYPAPAMRYAACLIRMRVHRMPIHALTPAQMDAVPEIPEEYHLDMLGWAAYLALRIVDHEMGDPGRAQEFKAQFEADAAKARTETMRKLFVPQPWGFGRNGFSYVGN
jgi:hypothetical protein